MFQRLPSVRPTEARDALVERWKGLVPFVLRRLRHDRCVVRYLHECHSAAYLALLRAEKLPEGTPALKLAKDPVGPGETVHALGNPGASGALWAYTPGSVKARYHKQWLAGVGKDVYVDQAVKVIRDMVAQQNVAKAGDKKETSNLSPSTTHRKVSPSRRSSVTSMAKSDCQRTF